MRDQLEDFIKEMVTGFSKQVEQLPFIFTLELDNGEIRPYMKFFESVKDKHKFFDHMARVIALHNPKRYAIATETWLSKYPKDGQMPCDDPDREDGIMFIIGDKDHEHGVTYLIDKDRNLSHRQEMNNFQSRMHKVYLKGIEIRKEMPLPNGFNIPKDMLARMEEKLAELAGLHIDKMEFKNHDA